MQDNIPPHSNKKLQNLLKMEGIVVFKRPSGSSNLNPIAHLWQKEPSDSQKWFQKFQCFSRNFLNNHCELNYLKMGYEYLSKVLEKLAPIYQENTEMYVFVSLLYEKEYGKSSLHLLSFDYIM